MLTCMGTDKDWTDFRVFFGNKYIFVFPWEWLNQRLPELFKLETISRYLRHRLRHSRKVRINFSARRWTINVVRKFLFEHMLFCIFGSRRLWVCTYVCSINNQQLHTASWRKHETLTQRSLYTIENWVRWIWPKYVCDFVENTVTFLLGSG